MAVGQPWLIYALVCRLTSEAWERLFTCLVHLLDRRAVVDGAHAGEDSQVSGHDLHNSL